MNRNIVTLIIAILAFIAAVYGIYTYSQSVRFSAYNACAQIAKYSQTRDGVTVSYPLAEVFNPCIERINGKK